MESHMDLEVPDTPDRLLRVEVGSSVTHQNTGHLDSHAYRQRLHQRIANITCISPDETELFFEQARLARLVSEDVEEKASSQSISTVQKLGQKELSHEKRESMEIYDLDHSSPLSPSCTKRYSSLRTQKGKEPVRERNVLGRCASSELLGAVRSSLTTVVAVRPSSQFRMTSSEQDKVVSHDETHTDAKSSNKGKDILLSNDLQPKSEQALPIPIPSDTVSKSKGQKRLVRNGCISPCNIQRNDNVTSQCNAFVSEEKKIVLPNGFHSEKLPREKLKIYSTNLSPNSDLASPCVSYSSPRSSIQSKLHYQHGMTCSRESPYTSFCGSNDQNNSEGADFSEESKQRKQRRLMQSQYITQSATALSRTAGKQKENKIETIALSEVPNGSNVTSSQLQNSNVHFKENYGSNKKGKAVIDDFSVSGGPNGKLVLKLGRPDTNSNTSVTDSRDTNGNTMVSEDLHCRTHSQTDVIPSLLSNHAVRVHKTEVTSDNHPDKSNKVGLRTKSYCKNIPEISDFPASNSSMEQEITLMNQKSLIREATEGKKRKHKEMNRSHGESSSSAFDNSEIFCLGTSRRSPRSKLRSSRTSNRGHGSATLGPIIEVDELLSPRVSHEDSLQRNRVASDNSSAMARQVESDELLARQLQEELYNQPPVSRNFEEIDAALARSLHHEENAQRALSSSRQTQPTRRGRMIARLRSEQPSRSSLSSSANYVRDRQSTRITQLMRDVNFQGMDISMRLEFLEDLEYAFDNGRGEAVSRILQVQRDFNENDYEMLLALDDNNNHHTGASQNQINFLPQSVVQSDNIEEPCAVCLEKPSIGDTIRHLPCLHKFHKDCIDEWLRRKTSCPVCKADVT